VFLEVEGGEDVFEGFEVVFDGLIDFGLLEEVFVFVDVLLHVGGDLFDIGETHVCGDKAFDHLVVEEKVDEFKVDFFLQV
jgi:hypothetical protein